MKTARPNRGGLFLLDGAFTAFNLGESVLFPVGFLWRKGNCDKMNKMLWRTGRGRRSEAYGGTESPR